MNELQINIPQDIENLALPNPELLTFYKNLEQRTLWIDDEINTYCLEYVRHILNWNKDDEKNHIAIENRKPIKLMIFSGGGDLNTTNSIIDVIELSKTPVYGYNMSMAYSGACYIFMKCHKRMALKKSAFLIHQGSADNFSGTYEQIVSAVYEYQRQIEELSKFILENSNIDKKTLEENIASEWYMDSKTAVECGICDVIIDDIDLIVGD